MKQGTTRHEPRYASPAGPRGARHRRFDSRTRGFLARHLGRFLKGCPGAGAEICCNYFVVNLASNCHLECTYCFLQAYLNNPALVVYTNVDDLLEEVRLKVVSAPDRMFRIGTGEISDSLALDGITRYSRRLVPSFGSLSNVVLEPHASVGASLHAEGGRARLVSLEANELESIWLGQP